MYYTKFALFNIQDQNIIKVKESKILVEGAINIKLISHAVVKKKDT